MIRSRWISFWLCIMLVIELVSLGQVAPLWGHFLTNLGWVNLVKSVMPFAPIPQWKAPDLIDTTLAQSYFAAALNITRNNVSSRRGSAYALWFGGQTNAAVEIWQALDATNHATPVDRLLLGWGYEYLQFSRKAEQVWKRLQVPSKYFETIYWQVRVVEGNSMRAFRMAEIIVNQSPDDPKNWMRLAQEYENQSKLQDAVMSWRRATLLLDPSRAEYWWALGRGAFARNDWLDASQAFARGLTLDPSDREMWRYAYFTKRLWGDYPGAAQIAIAWVRQMPLDAEAYLRTGQAYYEDANDVEAQVWFEKALRLDASSAEAQYYLGLIAKNQGDNDLALRRLEWATERNPKYAEAYFEMATLLMTSGESERAISLAEKAISLYPWGCPFEWNTRLGNWHQEIGQRDAAIKAYEAAIACNPSYTPATQALTGLEQQK